MRHPERNPCFPRTITLRDAAEVALQVCQALAHAHDQGCVHRDLKPSNLYLPQDGMVKLGDLGLARDLENSRLTASGQTVGTWRYMPPEQITGQENIDGRLDLYALGCILFEMIAGHVPFEGPDFATIFDQHLEAVPARLDILVANCPAALADLVDQLLEKKPADRPQDAHVVSSHLTTILSGNTPAKKQRPPRTVTFNSTAKSKLAGQILLHASVMAKRPASAGTSNGNAWVSWPPCWP